MKKYVVIIVESFLKAVHKESQGKDIYYLQATKHYDSGKSYTECIFLGKKDYDTLVSKFGEREEN